MKKYLATLLLVMSGLGSGMLITCGLVNLFEFLILDKGIKMWVVLLAFIFILSIVITTINYFSTKEDDKEDEEYGAD